MGGVVALGGRTQDRNHISQGRMRDIIVFRSANGWQELEKSGIDRRTGFHAHGKEQNEKYFFLLSIRYGKYRSGWHDRTSDIF